MTTWQNVLARALGAAIRKHGVLALALLGASFLLAIAGGVLLEALARLYGSS